MDLDPRIFFNLLFEYAEDDNVGPKKCSQLFTNLNDVLTREQLNISALGTVIYFHETLLL
jgi:hypothetical protein